MRYTVCRNNICLKETYCIITVAASCPSKQHHYYMCMLVAILTCAMLRHDVAVLDSEHDGEDAVGVEQAAHDQALVAVEELEEGGRQQHDLQLTAVDVLLHLRGNRVSSQVLHRQVA